MDDRELLTDRLSLRRPTPDDVDLIHTVHTDVRACVHNPAGLLATRADAEALYQRWDGHWRVHGFGYRVVRIRDTGEAVGFCGVKVVRFDGRPVLNLFYRFVPLAWGRGVATEAAAAVVDRARRQAPGSPLIARVRPENVASQRVATRAGLIRAAHLDRPGEDGPDWIYVSAWPDPPDRTP